MPQRAKSKTVEQAVGHIHNQCHFFTTRFKDFIFAIFQIQNLNGINLSEKYWIIQIMIIFMMVVVFHMCM
jgi:hypothetical protein